MKGIFFFTLLFICSLQSFSQKDLSGAYGYSSPVQKAQPPKDKTAVPGGQLVLGSGGIMKLDQCHQIRGARGRPTMELSRTVYTP